MIQVAQHVLDKIKSFGLNNLFGTSRGFEPLAPLLSSFILNVSSTPLLLNNGYHLVNKKFNPCFISGIDEFLENSSDLFSSNKKAFPFLLICTISDTCDPIYSQLATSLSQHHEILLPMDLKTYHGHITRLQYKINHLFDLLIHNRVPIILFVPTLLWSILFIPSTNLLAITPKFNTEGFIDLILLLRRVWKPNSQVVIRLGNFVSVPFSLLVHLTQKFNNLSFNFTFGTKHIYPYSTIDGFNGWEIPSFKNRAYAALEKAHIIISIGIETVNERVIYTTDYLSTLTSALLINIGKTTIARGQNYIGDANYFLSHLAIQTFPSFPHRPIIPMNDELATLYSSFNNYWTLMAPLLLDSFLLSPNYFYITDYGIENEIIGTLLYSSTPNILSLSRGSQLGTCLKLALGYLMSGQNLILFTSLATLLPNLSVLIELSRVEQRVLLFVADDGLTALPIDLSTLIRVRTLNQSALVANMTYIKDWYDGNINETGLSVIIIKTNN